MLVEVVVFSLSDDSHPSSVTGSRRASAFRLHADEIVASLTRTVRMVGEVGGQNLMGLPMRKVKSPGPEGAEVVVAAPIVTRRGGT